MKALKCKEQLHELHMITANISEENLNLEILKYMETLLYFDFQIQISFLHYIPIQHNFYAYIYISYTLCKYISSSNALLIGTTPAKIVGTLRRFPHIFSTDPPSPRYNVDLRRIFATFEVNLEHASLNQSFLPTNQHCFGGGGGREARTGRFARVTKNAMELF